MDRIHMDALDAIAGAQAEAFITLADGNRYRMINFVSFEASAEINLVTLRAYEYRLQEVGVLLGRDAEHVDMLGRFKVAHHAGLSDAEGVDAEDNVRRILGIAEGKRVLCIVAVGHKGMERKPQNEDRLCWDKVHSQTLIF